MRKKSHFRSFLYIILLNATILLPLHGQVWLPPVVSALPGEAPRSFFSTEVGDAEVELFIQGFWEAALLSSGSLAIKIDSAPAFNMMPFLFTQRPDLYLLLVFKRHWWVETSVADELARSTFAIGYTADEGQFLRIARIGNTGISLPDYPYMSFGGGSNAFGAMIGAGDTARELSVDAMIRWDGLLWRTRQFSGFSETIETIIRPQDHLRGRRFILPDYPISDILLYDLTPQENRLLGSDEYAVSLASGFIELQATPAGRLSVSYTVGAVRQPTMLLYIGPQATVDPAGSTPAAFPDSLVGTLDAPIEARNLYALTASTARQELFVRDLASGLRDMRFDVRQSGPGLIEVLPAGVTGLRDDVRGYARPFQVIAGRDWIYTDQAAGTDRPAYPPGEGFEIVARTVEAAEAISLGSEVLASTLAVYREGLQTQAFLFDTASGTLQLSPPPRPGESITVRYAIASQSREDGALAFALGTRFPWLGMRLALALGGRWAIPGTGYASGQDLRSAWTGLSAGVEFSSTYFSLNARSLLQYTRASATGLYRILGMDDPTSYNAPFRPVTGDIAAFELSHAFDATLLDAFPEPLSRMQTQAGQNLVFSIKALGPTLGNGSGTMELVRYIDPAPLTSFRQLSFFVNVADNVNEAAVLTLQLGDGKGGGASARLPLKLLVAGWQRIDLRLNQLQPLLVVQTADGQRAEQAADSGSYQPAAMVGELRLYLESLQEGHILIDEILLVDPIDGFSANIGLNMAIKTVAGGNPPFLVADLAGSAADELTVGGHIRAAFLLGPSEWTVLLNPLWSPDSGSFGLGYDFGFPSRTAINGLRDQFYRDIIQKQLSRTLDLSAAWGDLSGKASATMVESKARFDRVWHTTMGWNPWISVKAGLVTAAESTVFGTMDYGQSWMATWYWLLPPLYNDLSTRKLSVSAQLLSGLLSFDGWHDHLPQPVSRISLKLGLRRSFRLGLIDLEPTFERRLDLEGSLGSTGLVDDLDSLVRALESALPLIGAWPVADHLQQGLGHDFIRARAGFERAAYVSNITLAARRPIGFGMVDLFVPSSVLLGWARGFDARLDSIAEYHGITARLGSAAVNIFGFGGSRPLLSSVAIDEYSTDLQTNIRVYIDDGAILPEVNLKHTIFLEMLNGNTFSTVSRFSYRQTRTAVAWSESLLVGHGTRPERTWFGDLLDLVLVRINADPDDSGLVSGWLEALDAGTPIRREAYDLNLLVKSGEDGAFSVNLTGNYSTRVILPGTFSAGFKAAISPTLRMLPSGLLWGVGYEFGLDAKVVF
jgi:hypothetical protein